MAIRNIKDITELYENNNVKVVWDNEAFVVLHFWIISPEIIVIWKLFLVL